MNCMIEISSCVNKTPHDCAFDKKENCLQYKCAHQWVSVKDRIPEREIVLCKTNAKKGTYPEYFVGVYWADAGKWCSIDKWRICQIDDDLKVTHWMQLPESPND